MCKDEVLLRSGAVGEVAEKVGGLKGVSGVRSDVLGGAYLARHEFAGRV